MRAMMLDRSQEQGKAVNFDLSEDEEMLKALAERFVSDRYDSERRRAYRAEESGFSSRNWAMLAELGLIPALFDAKDGGLGLDANGIATIFEALGKGLVVEPLLDNGLLAGRLLAACADSEPARALAAQVVAGSRRVALAHAEQGGRGGRLWVETTARRNGSGTKLNGEKPFVVAGTGADAYLVTARLNGEPGTPDGVGLFLVPADSAGIEMRSWRMADGGAAVALTLRNVNVKAEHHLGEIGEMLEAVEILASLARSAEALGIMQRLFDETLEYLRTREQFGVKLGSFQALQHRMATQYAVLAQARGLLDLAIVSEGKPEFAQAVAGARAFIAPASLTLGHEAIQMHGGMGVTDELAIGHGHKRLFVLSRWPDDPDAAIDRFAGID
jgi:hypothetical protein